MGGKRRGVVGLVGMVGGICIEIANYYPTVRAALDAFRAAGGTGAVVVDVLTHPALGLVLILLGLWWMYRENHQPSGEPPNPEQTQDGAGNLQIGGSVHGNVTIGRGPEASATAAIALSRFGESQLYKKIAAFIVPGPPLVHEPKYYVCQIWFRNDGKAVAKAIAAFMTFRSVHDDVVNFVDVRGEWAVTNAPSNVAFDATRPTWDELPPNGDEIKLVVALKWPNESDAFVWLEGGKEYPGRRHTAFRLPPGEYELSVRVRGIEVDQRLMFHFTNPANGHPFLSVP